MRIAIIAITRNGARLGTRLKAGLGNADLYVLKKYHGQAGSDAVPFTEELAVLIARLWQGRLSEQPGYSGFICIMATGIVVRLVAPLLEGKEKDPAVVVMDDAGKFAVSLLSGHLGGANELAERCAFITGSRPVITTATDANDLPSFDMLAKEQGWAIEDLSRVKVFNSLLLDGEEIAVIDSTGLVRPYFHGRGNLSFYDTFVAALRSNARGIVLVANTLLPPQMLVESILVLRPRNLVLGIGCNSGTPVEEILEVVRTHLKRLFLVPKSVSCIATAEAKRNEAGLVSAAEALGVPLVCFTSEELNDIDVPSPPSQYALAAIGAAGVAEPAALLASHGGNLLLKKVKSGNVTLAIVEEQN